MTSTLRYMTPVAMSALLAIGLTACGRDETTQGCSSSCPTTTPNKATFAMSVEVSVVPFWNDTRLTWTSIGEGLSYKTIFGGPPNLDGSEQIRQIDALIAQHVSGLVVCPTDSAALGPEIDKAVASGIPVVTYLNDSPGSRRLAYVTSEREEASLKVGRLALRGVSGGGDAIVMYSGPGNEEEEARLKGFQMLAKQNPGLKIVDVVSDKFDSATGASRIRPLLAKYPNLKFIFGSNSRSAAGAVSALKESNTPPGKVVVTGWDADADVVALVKAGWVTASVYQDTPYMTQTAFSILAGQVGGWSYPSNRRFKQAGVSVVPQQIIVPVQLVTKDNADAYDLH